MSTLSIITAGLLAPAGGGSGLTPVVTGQVRQDLVNAMVAAFANSIPELAGRVSVWRTELPTPAECPCLLLWDTLADCGREGAPIGSRRHELQCEAVVFLAKSGQGVAARKLNESVMAVIDAHYTWGNLAAVTRITGHELDVKKFGALAGAAKVSYTVEYYTTT